MNVSLYQAAAALNVNSRWQEVIAENMASSSIPGYRKQEISQAAVQAGLMPAGSSANSKSAQFFSIPKATATTSFATGDLHTTGDNNDVGIEGKGFFQVQLPNGAIASTRDGEFQVNSKSQLVTNQGYPVMGEGGPIQLSPAGSGPLTIAADGTVSQGADTKGKLKLVDFKKPELLTQISGAYFLANDTKAQPGPATGTLRQGFLEGANTTAVGEMANMMIAMRTFEANQHVIQIQDDRLNKVITEMGATN